MNLDDLTYLYDEIEQTRTRYVGFIGNTRRFDLAIIQTDKYYGKVLVLDLQSNRFAIIGTDDLQAPGYLEHNFNLNEEEAEELRQFLYTVVV